MPPLIDFRAGAPGSRIRDYRGALWTPAALGSNLIAWYAAKETASITIVSDKVDSIADLSGNARTASAPHPDVRPNYSATAFNGHPAIVFPSRGGRYIQASHPSGSYAGSLYCLIRSDGSASVHRAPFILGTGDFSDHYPWVDGNIYSKVGSTVRKGPFASGLTLTSEHLVSVESADGEWTMRQNGEVTHTTATNSAGWPSSATYGAGAVGVFGFAGAFAEWLVCETILSTGDRQKVEGYMMHRVGLQASLPGGHPYLTEPPRIG